MSKGSTTGFECDNCHKWVVINEFIGTKNRNHCPFCLFSKHVDGAEAGDRSASCHGKMQAVGLTIKQAGIDKYGKPRQGELMLVHICQKCGKISINRIAADDDTDLITELLDTAQLPAEQIAKIEADSIKLLDKTDAEQVKTLLFGKQTT